MFGANGAILTAEQWRVRVQQCWEPSFRNCRYQTTKFANFFKLTNPQNIFSWRVTSQSGRAGWPGSPGSWWGSTLLAPGPFQRWWTRSRWWECTRTPWHWKDHSFRQNTDRNLVRAYLETHMAWTKQQATFSLQKQSSMLPNHSQGCLISLFTSTKTNKYKRLLLKRCMKADHRDGCLGAYLINLFDFKRNTSTLCGKS